MGTSKSKTNENSVNVALQELMVMEDDRQVAETEERKRQEEDERRRREEEERARINAEEQRRREEEDARLASERAAEDQKAREAREEQERKLKIQLETEAKARALEQQRLLEHELEIKRLDAEKKVIPKWLIALIVVSVLGSAIGGFLWYQASEAEKAAQRQAYLEERERIRKSAEEELRLLQEALANTKKKEQEAQDALKSAEARGDEEAMRKARRQLQEAQERSAQAKAKQKRATKSRTKKKGGGGLSDDPLGGFKLD